MFTLLVLVAIFVSIEGFSSLNISPKCSICALSLRRDEKIDIVSDVPSSLTYGLSLGILPAVWYVTIPELLSRVTDFSVAAEDRQVDILLLLVTKRVALYSTAASFLNLCAIRAVCVQESLGQRLAGLNDEVFEVFGSNFTALLEDESVEAVRVLDETDGQTQAVALPVLVAGSLLASFIPVVLSNALSGSSVDNVVGTGALEISKPFLQILSQTLPSVSLLSSAAVVLLFSRVELKVFLSSFRDRNENEEIGIGSNVMATIIGMMLVVTSFYSAPGGIAWPIQNLSNMLTAIVISRAVQLPRLPWIVVSLIGLTCYDLVAVTGTQALTDNGASIMEAVARAKSGLSGVPNSMYTAIEASSGTTQSIAGVASSQGQWLPGILQVSVGQQVSDLLGLGDIVFPSILAGWAKRWDIREEKEGRESGIYRATLSGFAIGCLLCEILQTGSGQPALIYLVPAMLATTATKGLFTGQLGRMWEN